MHQGQGSGGEMRETRVGETGAGKAALDCLPLRAKEASFEMIDNFTYSKGVCLKIQ